MSKPSTMVIIVLIFLSLIAAQCSSLVTAPPAESQSTTADEAAAVPSGPVIKVLEPRARASMPNGAVYMHLMNEGDADDRLIRADSDVAEAVELHESKMDENEVMRMSPVEMIAVPASGSAILEPGGKHIMLLGLTEELATGDSFEVTLTFEQTGPQTVEVVVTESMAMGQDHGDHEGHMAEEDSHNHDKIRNEGAVISIVSPAPGSEFAAGEMIMIKVETEGFDLATTDNHWHLYVDGELVEMVEDGKKETMLHDLESGEHTIMTTMADNDHNELEDGAMISVVVK